MYIREFIIDPSTNKFSASRLCLMVEVLLFVPLFVVLAALGVLPKEFAGAIGTMLGVVVGATCGVYGVSTYTSGNVGEAAFLTTTLTVPPPVAGITKAKTNAG